MGWTVFTNNCRTPYFGAPRAFTIAAAVSAVQPFLPDSSWDTNDGVTPTDLAISDWLLPRSLRIAAKVSPLISRMDTRATLLRRLIRHSQIPDSGYTLLCSASVTTVTV